MGCTKSKATAANDGTSTSKIISSYFNRTYDVDVQREILQNTNLIPDIVSNILVPYLEFSGVERCTLNGHTDFICCIAVLPTGHFCSGSVDKSIKIWSRDGLCLQTLTGKNAYKFLIFVLFISFFLFLLITSYIFLMLYVLMMDYKMFFLQAMTLEYIV